MLDKPIRKDCNRKRDFRTRKRAKTAAQRALGKHGHRLYPYKCINGHVHLTSQDPAESRHKERENKKYENIIVKSRDGVGFHEDPTGVIYKGKEVKTENVS